MIQVALVGMSAFILASIVVGGRLILLSRSAHHLPALSIGLSLLLTGGVGYALMFTALALPAQVGDHLPWIQGAGQACVTLGAGALWLFTWRTFRPSEKWAAGIFFGTAALLIVAYGMVAIQTGFSVPVRSGHWFWLGFATRALALVWAGAESFRYYGLMKRRERLGLASPLLVNRFLLWGIGSATGATAAAISGTMIVLGPAADPTTIALLRLATAAGGLAAATAIWLAFFPPIAYRRRFVAAGAEGAIS